MKKLMIGLFSLVALSAITAQDGGQGRQLVIYKWIQDGITNYGHILPEGVTDYVKLDAEGFLLEDLPSEDTEFNGLLRPTQDAENVESAKKPEKEEEKKKDENVSEQDQALATLNKKNCEIAQANLKILQGKQAFDMKPDGVKIIEGKELEARRAKEQKNIDYFCTN